MRKRFFLIVSLIICVALLLSTTIACVPKKSSTQSTTNTSATTEQDIAALKATVNDLKSKVTSAEEEIAALPQSQSYDDDIIQLQDDIASLQDSSSIVLDDVDARLAEWEEQQSSSVVTGPAKYALVTEVGRKYIEVAVYGAGDYPVIVTLYGTGLEIDKIDAEDDDIVDEYLFGTYTLTSETGATLSVSDGTFTTTEAIPDDPLLPPSAHVHEITVDGLTVSGASYSLTFNGTMLVVVIEPDKEWIAEDTFELDIRDVGEIYYASALVSAGE